MVLVVFFCFISVVVLFFKYWGFLKPDSLLTGFRLGLFQTLPPSQFWDIHFQAANAFKTKHGFVSSGTFDCEHLNQAIQNCMFLMQKLHSASLHKQLTSLCSAENKLFLGKSF